MALKRSNHLNQTATFVLQESIIRKYCCDGDSVFQIFYDLEKAFDSVGFLSHLYKAAGHSWKILGIIRTQWSYYLS